MFYKKVYSRCFNDTKNPRCDGESHAPRINYMRSICGFVQSLVLLFKDLAGED